jgi:hypothetical protein
VNQPKPLRSHAPTAEQNAFMDDLKATLARHTVLSGQEMLAVASQFVGQLIAFQDQRQLTPERAMDLVASNIEAGNAAALEALISNPAGRA